MINNIRESIMSQQIINIGVTPNDMTGDSIRNAFSKTNSNFKEVYTALSVLAGGTLLTNPTFSGDIGASGNVNAVGSINCTSLNATNTVACNTLTSNTVNATVLNLQGTAFLQLPVGNTAQRVGNVLNGMIRYNTDLSNVEAVINGVWQPLGPSTTSSGAASFRNRIINGDMRIDQRNAGYAYVGPTSGSYTLDRWIYFGPPMFNIQQNAGNVAPPSGFSSYLGCTVTSAYTVTGDASFNIAQFIEGYNVADFGFGAAGAKTITLSFWVMSSLSGTFAGALRNYANNRSYVFTYSIGSANTWTYITVTIPGDTTGAWIGASTSGSFLLSFDLGTGPTYSGTAGAWVSGNYVSAPGAVSTVGTLGATFYVTGVQLELGSSATPFELIPFTLSLSICKRYFECSYDYGTPVGYPTNNTAFAHVLVAAQSYPSVQVIYNVAKRVIPTVTLYSTNDGSTGNMYDVSTGTNLHSALISSSTCGFLGCVDNILVAQGDTVRLAYAANAEI
jgi:hypothetical protein